MNTLNPRMAYVSILDPANILAWSGLVTNIRQALQNSAFDITNIGPLRKPMALIGGAKKVLYRSVLDRRYFHERNPGVQKAYGKQAAPLMGARDFDLIFSPGTMAISHLETKKPIAFWTDATFAGVTGFYPEYSDLCEETRLHGDAMEQMALSRSSLAIYSSQWAADSARQRYKVDPAKVHMVPFGPNINCDRDLGSVTAVAKRKSFDCCRLLFLGVDWVRKGGEKALEVATLLNAHGLRTELHVVGCTPSPGLPEFVRSYGFVSKGTAEGRQLLDRLLGDSHFLILPSVAESCAVVFSEASSFGLPSLSTNVGGIPTAIATGNNGFTFDLTAPAEAYCEVVERYFRDRNAYEDLARSSFNEYSTRLNWRTAGEKVRQLVAAHCHV